MGDRKPYNGNSSSSMAKEKENSKSNDSSSVQLETSKAERRVWLMKCPPVISNAMQSSGNNNYVVKVIVTVDPLNNDDQESTKFTMEMNDTTGNTPKCYSMNMSTDVIPMSVFSESTQGKLSVEGKIHHKFDTEPHNKGSIEDYGKVCRERMNKYVKTRQIRIIDDDNGMRMRPMPGMLDFKTSSVSAEKKKVPAKASENKRTRKDPGEMEKIMFKLFERQPNWTLKQLIQETDQPEQFLKDMLKLLCVYNNKGANQGSYELKPEYRRSEDKHDSK